MKNSGRMEFHCSKVSWPTAGGAQWMYCPHQLGKSASHAALHPSMPSVMMLGGPPHHETLHLHLEDYVNKSQGCKCHQEHLLQVFSALM
jgi:hypothetical protein